MIQSKGYAAQSETSDLAPWDFERRELTPKDVLIEILYCGVCHTDLHQIRNDWAPGIFPMVPGHEIVGRVSKVGSGVTKFKAGDLAAVGVMIHSCQECDDCKNHQEHFCTVEPVITYGSIDQYGQPTYGGYSNNIVVSEDFTYSVSDKLNLAAVAPLLCAGITTYSPIKKWKIGKGHKLGVIGLGGLGHMAVKFGVAMGAEVTVISTSPDKKDDALKLGATNFVVSKDEEQMKAAASSLNFIIDAVAANHEIAPYMSLLKTEGILILVGMPSKPFQLHAFNFAMGNKAVVGSGAGGVKETQEMLDFCAENNIVSDIELIDIKDIHHAFDRMEKGDVRYRFVIDMNSLK